MIREPMGGWFVWQKNGRRPHFKHPDHDSAVREAERLARENPGRKFIVLQMIAKYHEPEPEQLAEPPQADPLRELADGTEV